ncbi:hypothetical protein [Mycolicibacterium cosmeticum]|uniref:hypothetical protein n=1 Tax=Mycolicibacterium cosmeticum TaxID=258533 RepID=UPI003204F7BD
MIIMPRYTLILSAHTDCVATWPVHNAACTESIAFVGTLLGLSVMQRQRMFSRSSERYPPLSPGERWKMAKPTRKGELGETVFDGEFTWMCLGGTKWTKHIDRESEALHRNRFDDELEER